MASALIQCVTRTQAGWITPGTGAAWTASAGCSAAWTLIGSFALLCSTHLASGCAGFEQANPAHAKVTNALFVLAHAVFGHAVLAHVVLGHGVFRHRVLGHRVLFHSVFLHGVGLAYAVFRHIVGESGRREGERETDRRCGERQDGAGSLHCVVLLKGFGGAFRGHPL